MQVTQSIECIRPINFLREIVANSPVCLVRCSYSAFCAVLKIGILGCDRPLLAASSEEGAWDGGSVGAPCVVPMAGGAYRLYYGGRPKGETGAWSGFGLALTGKGETEASFEGARVDFLRRKAL